MLTAGHFFLLYFFPIFILIYLIFFKFVRVRDFIIIIFSLIFYASFGIENLPILIIPLIIDYFLAVYIYKSKNKLSRKLLLTFGILVNIGLLGYFKYANFFAINLEPLFPDFQIFQNLSQKIILPVGISFITFQRISYIIDVYRKEITPSKNFLKYCTYAVLFPHLLSGPIVRFSFIKKQLIKRAINFDTIFEASKYFSIGFAFKILIADQLFIVEDLFTNTLSSNNLYSTLILILYFSIRIYFDFLGYSLMAIGLAKFIGFDFPYNFDSPYQSKSIQEFWRRWNITLSSWIRDYLYIPLGGNRKGKIRTYINLMITMSLAGLWHGASWNFIIWGGLHGLYLSIENFFRDLKITFRIPQFIRIGFTFILVTLTWIAFKFTNISDIRLLINSLANLKFVPFDRYTINVLLPSVPFLIFALLWSFFLKEKSISKFNFSTKNSFFFLALFVFTLFFSLIKKAVPFIYFQF